MIVTTATTTADEMGPLCQIVKEFSDLVESVATAQGCTAEDWEPLSELVAVDEFERVGAYMEVMTWSDYVKFMTEWAGATRFEAIVRRISEIGRCVFYEIVERHYKGDEFIEKNVIAVYEFNDDNKIRHLDIYEQAEDSGQWIIDAARSSTESSAAP